MKFTVPLGVKLPLIVRMPMLGLFPATKTPLPETFPVIVPVP